MVVVSFSTGAGSGTALQRKGLIQPHCPINTGLGTQQSPWDSKVLSSTSDTEPAR